MVYVVDTQGCGWMTTCSVAPVKNAPRLGTILCPANQTSPALEWRPGDFYNASPQLLCNVTILHSPIECSRTKIEIIMKNLMQIEKLTGKGRDMK